MLAIVSKWEKKKVVLTLFWPFFPLCGLVRFESLNGRLVRLSRTGTAGVWFGVAVAGADHGGSDS